MESNTARGKIFQLAAREALHRMLGVAFDLEVALPIGSPPRPHVFDFASGDRRYVGEAKSFTWTISGNTPSAKITTLREAIQYLKELPFGTKTFIVMKKAQHPIRKETLAAYFARLNTHLVGATAILELDDKGCLSVVTGDLKAGT